MSVHVVLCAHGTDDPDGRAVIGAITAAVGRRLADDPRTLEVSLVFVDVQDPALATTLPGVAGPTVVVPLLLAPGYHTEVDVAEAVTTHGRAVAAATLGPHPALAAVLADRLREAGADPDRDVVVLATAGSSRAAAAEVSRRQRDLLAAVWPGAVILGFGAGAEPRVPTAVATARAQWPGRRVVIASHLLGRGFFHDQLAEAGADLVSAPLGADERVVDVVVDRLDDALDLTLDLLQP